MARKAAQNSGKTAKGKPPRGRPFAKGGDSRRNKGGRPPVPQDVKQAYRAHNAHAVRRLVELSECGKSCCRVALGATLELIARAEGRTPQKLELTGKDGGPIATARPSDLSRYTDEELDQLEAIQRAAAARSGGSGEAAPEAQEG